MKKSEIFVPLSRNRTRKNDRDGFRDVFRTGSGVLYGGGRPGAGCGQETGDDAKDVIMFHGKNICPKCIKALQESLTQE